MFRDFSPELPQELVSSELFVLAGCFVAEGLSVGVHLEDRRRLSVGAADDQLLDDALDVVVELVSFFLELLVVRGVLPSQIELHRVLHIALDRYVQG